MGVSYSSQTAVVRLEHNVAIEMIPADANADKSDKQSSDRKQRSRDRSSGLGYRKHP